MSGHNALISATCVRAKFVGEMAGPCTNCTDCCIMLSNLVGGGGGCSCTLLLHPVPTSAGVGFDLCTLNPALWRCRWCGCSYETVVV